MLALSDERLTLALLPVIVLLVAPVRVFVAPVIVFADAPAVPIVFVVPCAVRFPLTPKVLLNVVAPDTPNVLLRVVAPGLPVHVPLAFVFLAVSVSFAIGLAAGVTPARRAALLDPIEALRAE